MKNLNYVCYNRMLCIVLTKSPPTFLFLLFLFHINALQPFLISNLSFSSSDHMVCLLAGCRHRYRVNALYFKGPFKLSESEFFPCCLNFFS